MIDAGLWLRVGRILRNT